MMGMGIGMGMNMGGMMDRQDTRKRREEVEELQEEFRIWQEESEMLMGRCSAVGMGMGMGGMMDRQGNMMDRQGGGGMQMDRQGGMMDHQGGGNMQVDRQGGMMDRQGGANMQVDRQGGNRGRQAGGPGMDRQGDGVLMDRQGRPVDLMADQQQGGQRSREEMMMMGQAADGQRPDGPAGGQRGGGRGDDNVGVRPQVKQTYYWRDQPEEIRKPQVVSVKMVIYWKSNVVKIYNTSHCPSRARQIRKCKQVRAVRTCIQTQIK
jgi:hypothetical protein